MIRIGVFSDSHGFKEQLQKAVALAGQIDLAIHCGDGGEDLEAVLAPEIPRLIVRGNCDLRSHYPEEILHRVAEHTIMIVHGHRYDVKFDYNRLFYKGLESSANIVLFGHTHVAEIIDNKEIILMNPGSVVRPTLGGKPSFGIIEIEHKIPNCRIINFG